MRKTLMIAAAFAMPLTAAPVMADGHSEAPELAKKDWYNIVYFKFQAGKAGEAMKLIETFQAVDATLGREAPTGFHMNSGEWDMMVAFKMHDGIQEMGWASNPRGDEWNAELARQLGGEDKVREHWEKYFSLVVNTKSEIAHIDTD
uniref:hypothetical protein n=1 Tax=uncultured Erythrobacter sp. TaxID=263913 RepID=UPI002618F343|nr:hypothetical protein [uncultured Erythrobacter sp.]